MALSPFTSWQVDGEKVEAVTDFIFLGSKITVDCDCSHGIKRHLPFGRKAVTNLDSRLKSRDITLPTKVHLDKAMVFPVVMRVGPWRALKNCSFWTVVLEKTLESPWDCKEIKPVNPEEINPKYSLEGLMLKLKLQYFGHLIKGSDSLEKILMLRKIGKFSSISPQLSIFETYFPILASREVVW